MPSSVHTGGASGGNVIRVRDLNMKEHFVIIIMKVNTLRPPPQEKIDLFKLNGKCMLSYVKEHL